MPGSPTHCTFWWLSCGSSPTGASRIFWLDNETLQTFGHERSKASMVTPLALSVYLSQAPDPNQDWLGIIVFGFDFVFFSLILIALFNRIANSKAGKVWPKLAPVIKGTFHKGIGLTTPYLAGNYRGLPVRACLRARAKSRWTFEYYFEIV